MSTSLSRDSTKIANLRYIVSIMYKKKRGAVAYYLSLRHRQTPVSLIMKQQPTLYTDIFPAYDEEVYSRAQAFVAYYSKDTKRFGDF